jgi:hypothetical protein
VEAGWKWDLSFWIRVVTSLSLKFCREVIEWVKVGEEAVVVIVWLVETAAT